MYTFKSLRHDLCHGSQCVSTRHRRAIKKYVSNVRACLLVRETGTLRWDKAAAARLQLCSTEQQFTIHNTFHAIMKTYENEALSARVARQQRCRVGSGTGRKVDDRTALPRNHARQRQARHADGRIHVHLYQRIHLQAEGKRAIRAINQLLGNVFTWMTLYALKK